MYQLFIRQRSKTGGTFKNQNQQSKWSLARFPNMQEAFTEHLSFQLIPWQNSSSFWYRCKRDDVVSLRYKADKPICISKTKLHVGKNFGFVSVFASFFITISQLTRYETFHLQHDFHETECRQNLEVETKKVTFLIMIF